MQKIYVVVDKYTNALVDNYFTTDVSVAQAQCDELNNEVSAVLSNSYEVKELHNIEQE